MSDKKRTNSNGDNTLLSRSPVVTGNSAVTCDPCLMAKVLPTKIELRPRRKHVETHRRSNVNSN